MRTKIKHNRTIARETGQRYYMGKTCPKGHDGLRFVSNGGCVYCNADKTRKGNSAEWRQENRERYNQYMREYQAKWREENRDYYNKRHREWVAKRKEKQNNDA